jgi:hypothetical protein
MVEVNCQHSSLARWLVASFTKGVFQTSRKKLRMWVTISVSKFLPKFDSSQGFITKIVRKERLDTRPRGLSQQKVIVIHGLGSILIIIVGDLNITVGSVV